MEAAELQQALERLALVEAQNQQLQQQLQAAQVQAAHQQAAPVISHLPGATIKPPKPNAYKGGKGVILWLAKLEQYFDVMNAASDVVRIQYAGLLLEGPAATWWTNVRETARLGLQAAPTTWAEFRTMLCNRFQPVTEEKLARQHLRKLAQNRTLQDYIDTFQDLVLKIPSMDEETKLDSFCFGLKPDCRLYVRQQDPHTLVDAIKCALRFQATIVEDRAAERAMGRKWQRNLAWGQERHGSGGPHPMELGNATVDMRNKQQVAGQRQSFKQDNMVFKCYDCGQPGHKAFECPRRNKQHRNHQSRPPRSVQARCMQEFNEEEN